MGAYADGEEDNETRVHDRYGSGEMSRRVGFDVRDRERELGLGLEQAHPQIPPR